MISSVLFGEIVLYDLGDGGVLRIFHGFGVLIGVLLKILRCVLWGECVTKGRIMRMYYSIFEIRPQKHGLTHRNYSRCKKYVSKPPFDV